jgi:competence protein ComFC
MARSAFYYAPPVNRLIREQKYDNRRYLAEVFAPFMAGTLAKSFSDVDVITFVPMTEKARRKRGYNQAELMAREISRLTGSEVEELFVKRAETVRQARLNRKERLSNLKGAIKAGNRQLIANKVVVVVDDVITTGATAEAVAAALKRAGAAKVYVLTAASVTDARVARVLGQERSESAVRREKQRQRQMKKLEQERIKAAKSKVD